MAHELKIALDIWQFPVEIDHTLMNHRMKIANINWTNLNESKRKDGV